MRISLAVHRHDMRLSRPEVFPMSLRRPIAISILMVALASVAFAHDDPVAPARGTLAQTQPATPPATPAPATQAASFDTVQMRTEKVAEGTPIVVFSADRDAREKARRLAADAALRKPFQLEELQDVVERLIKKPAA